MPSDSSFVCFFFFNFFQTLLPLCRVLCENDSQLEKSEANAPGVSEVGFYEVEMIACCGMDQNERIF